MLMEEHRMKQAGTTLIILTQYGKQGDDFLSRIVVGEIWVSHVTPELKSM